MSKLSAGAFALLEELMFTHQAVSEDRAILKDKVFKSLKSLPVLKEMNYVVELDDGRIYVTRQGVQTILAHFS
jgi:hypothetical protein